MFSKQQKLVVECLKNILNWIDVGKSTVYKAPTLRTDIGKITFINNYFNHQNSYRKDKSNGKRCYND